MATENDLKESVSFTRSKAILTFLIWILIVATYVTLSYAYFKDSSINFDSDYSN